MKPRVTVIGSANLDTFICTDHYPKMGETLLATAIHQFPGGKGANQAVAAAKLGAEVTFIGAFGQDEAGKQLKKALLQEGIDISFSPTLTEKNTGTAYILSTPGDNLVIVDSGANHSLTATHIDSARTVIQESDLLLLQLEIPLQTVQHACQIAFQRNIPIILNPAPAALLPTSLIELVSLLTPNEHELQALLHPTEKVIDLDTMSAQMQDKIIVTKGAEGVMYYDSGSMKSKCAYPVKVVDTTGAGDVFNGALAAFWHLGREQAISKAIAAASLSVTKMGAFSSAPSYEELEKFLNNNLPQTKSASV
ncbi:MAG: ribokinase [Neisseriaceae bacterium]